MFKDADSKYFSSFARMPSLSLHKGLNILTTKKRGWKSSLKMFIQKSSLWFVGDFLVNSNFNFPGKFVNKIVRVWGDETRTQKFYNINSNYNLNNFSL